MRRCSASDDTLLLPAAAWCAVMEDSATIVSLSIFATGGAAFWACCTHARSTVSESESTGTHGRGGVLARGRAVVYADKGAGRRSVATLVAALRDHGLTVRTILADEVVAGGWEHGCDLFAMPGGADQPYCALLNGRGNARIRAFVAGGGSFLGVCAGGYYGSASCEFELGSELQVTGARELAFFPGIARGAAFPGFVYAKETGSRAAELVLPSSERERAASPNFRDASATMNSCMVYVNGGCGFLAEDGTAADSVPGCEVLAWFADPEVAERIGQAGSPTRECHSANRLYICVSCLCIFARVLI